MRSVAKFISFILTLLILLAGSIMWHSRYPEKTLCNIVTPAMGTRDLPLIYPTHSGILGNLSLSFMWNKTPTTSTGSICTAIELFTPTTQIIGDILSGAPSYIHGLICPESAYNYSAFAHLVSGPYTEARAYTSTTYFTLYRLIKKTDRGRLKVVENTPADINIYLKDGKLCISGKVKTDKDHLMATISALLGIPYPIWGASPDWNILKDYYSSDELLLMKIKYLELLTYRVEYLSLLQDNPVNLTEIYIKPYLYQVEHMEYEAEAQTASSIKSLTQESHKLIISYQNKMRKKRIMSLLVALLLLIPIAVLYPWESVVGLVAGLTIIAISPAITLYYLISFIFILVAILYLFTARVIKGDMAISTSIMAISLFLPTILTITWWGIYPLLKEPSPFMAHLMSLTIPSATITSAIAIAIYILQIIFNPTSQETAQEEPPEP